MSFRGRQGRPRRTNRRRRSPSTCAKPAWGRHCSRRRSARTSNVWLPSVRPRPSRGSSMRPRRRRRGRRSSRAGLVRRELEGRCRVVRRVGRDVVKRGVRGSCVDLVHVCEAGVGSTLLAASVARTSNVWLPSARPDSPSGDVHAPQAPPSGGTRGRAGLVGRELERGRRHRSSGRSGRRRWPSQERSGRPSPCSSAPRRSPRCSHGQRRDSDSARRSSRAPCRARHRAPGPRNGSQVPPTSAEICRSRTRDAGL